jgi:hypothetical protein
VRVVGIDPLTGATIGEAHARADPTQRRIVVLIVAYPGYRGDDLRIYRTLTTRRRTLFQKLRVAPPNPDLNIVLVLNKIDLAREAGSTPEEVEADVLKHFGVRPVLISALKRTNLEGLVQEILRQMPPAARSEFERALDERYKMERRDRSRGLVISVGAEAAITKVDELLLGTGRSKIEALFRGLMIRETLDFSGLAGTSAFKSEVAPMLSSIRESLTLKRTLEEARTNKEMRYEKAVEWAWKEMGDSTSEGGLAGLISGAALGTAVAPGWGTIIGGLLGLLFGSSLGLTHP